MELFSTNILLLVIMSPTSKLPSTGTRSNVSTTPTNPRATRSNSKSELSLDNIKTIIYSAQTETLSAIRDEISILKSEINNHIATMSARVDKLEQDYTTLLSEYKFLKDSIQNPLPKNASHNSSNDQDVGTDSMKTEFEAFKKNYSMDMNSLHTSCQYMSKHLNLLQMDKRKECFIVRNFPEKNINVNGSEISNCKEAVMSIATALGLERECQNIQNIQRLGKVRSDGKPRVMKIKANAETSRLFLQNARKLKFAPSPLNKVFLQADLPIEVNRRLAEMRKRAYDHRKDHPDDSAYVKNMKLYINDVIVDEIKLDF